MEEVRLGLIGRIAAWLHLWTPPRGAVVPPAPWRKIAIGAAVLFVALAVLAAVLVPRADRHAAATRERESAAASAQHAAFLASVARTEAPHLGSGDLAAAKSQIAAATKGHKVIDVECEVFPRQVGKVAIKPKMTYDCTAVTAKFHLAGKSQPGLIGVPFRLAINTGAARFAFCQIVPLGAEDRLSHPLPAACLTPR